MLERCKANEGKETLGVFLAMDSNTKDQKEKLYNKTLEFSDHVRNGKLSRGEVWYALKSTITKTLECPMEAISLKKKDWDDIMKIIWDITLSVSGYNKKSPRNIVYMPRTFYGFGIMHLWHLQHMQQMILLLEPTRTGSITGDL